MKKNELNLFFMEINAPFEGLNH